MISENISITDFNKQSESDNHILIIVLSKCPKNLFC